MPDRRNNSAVRSKAGRQGRLASPWGRVPMVRAKENEDRLEQWKKLPKRRHE